MRISADMQRNVRPSVGGICQPAHTTAVSCSVAMVRGIGSGPGLGRALPMSEISGRDALNPGRWLVCGAIGLAGLAMPAAAQTLKDAPAVLNKQDAAAQDFQPGVGHDWAGDYAAGCVTQKQRLGSTNEKRSPASVMGQGRPLQDLAHRRAWVGLPGTQWAECRNEP